MEPRVYRMRGYVQLYHWIIGLWLVGSAAFLGLHLHSFLIAIVAGGPGIYYCRWAIRSRLMLGETEVSVRYASGEDSARISEIEGWREESGGGWELRLRGRVRSLRIDRRFAVDDIFLDFISKLRDLNQSQTSVVS